MILFRWGAISPPARSPSSSPTSRARPCCCTIWAPRPMRKRSPTTGGWCGMRARCKAASRLTRKGTPSSSLSRRRRERSRLHRRSRTALPQDGSGCGSGCTRGRLSSPTRATWGPTSTGRPGSPLRATPDRRSCRLRPQHSSGPTACATSASIASRTSRLPSACTSSATRSSPLSTPSIAQTCRCRRRPSSAEGASSRR